MSKYRNKRISVDGITFDSKKEAARYSDLKLLERAGVIKGLQRQIPYDLIYEGVKICRYVADFRYIENNRLVVEDCKGVRTRDYVIKRKLMRAFFGITILET